MENENTANVTAETNNEAPKVETTENSGSTRVSMERFIQTWEDVVDEGGGTDEVAKRLGLSPGTCTQRASNYRTKHGLDLSAMPKGGGSRLKVDAGKELLAKIKAKRAEREAGKADESTENKEAPASE